MKKTILLILMLFMVQGVFAQNVSIENGIDQIGGGYNPSLRVKIPHTDEKTLKKKWISFLKDNGAKVRKSRKEIKGEHTVINGLGAEALEIFSSMSMETEGMLLKVAFVKAGVFVSPTGDETYMKRLETIMYDFALTQAKEGVNKKLEAVNDQFKKEKKEQQKLIKNNERMAAENESMKKRIEKNEAQTKENVEKVEQTKKNIETHSQSLELLRAKLNELK